MKYIKCTTFYAINSNFSWILGGGEDISWIMEVHKKRNDNIKY